MLTAISDFVFHKFYNLVLMCQYYIKLLKIVHTLTTKAHEIVSKDYYIEYCTWSQEAIIIEITIINMSLRPTFLYMLSMCEITKIARLGQG